MKKECNLIEIEPINLTKEQIAKEDAFQMVVNASKLTITGQEELKAANSMLKVIKSSIKQFTAKRMEATKPLDESKRQIMTWFKEPILKLQEGEQYLKKIMLAYTTECERERRDQEEKLRRQAEAEERKKRIALEKRAQNALANGNIEKAEGLRDKAENISIDAPILADTTPKVEGVSYRTDYSGEVIDFEKLPNTYKIANLTLINKILKASKGRIAIAGIKVIERKILVSRGC